MTIPENQSLIDTFCEVFDVWEPARPYLPLMVNEDEMRLVVAIGGRQMDVSQIANLLNLPKDEATELLERAYSRCVVNKICQNEGVFFSPAEFYDRLDHFAKYESWTELPREDRQRIHRRFLDEFISRHRTNIERKMKGLAAENALPNDTVMLLSEIEEMIEAAELIVVQPCDCRKLGENCDLPVETCIWLDEGARDALDRGHGRQLTEKEAVKLVRWADKKGLMHTADSAWKERGLHAICNCCACDCYPFTAAQELGTKGVWPKSHYIAEHDTQLCNQCGACVRRCHFDAFYHDGSMVEVDGKLKEVVYFDPKLCWGCGLCANTCPDGAITMDRLSGD